VARALQVEQAGRVVAGFEDEGKVAVRGEIVATSRLIVGYI
jgi:hypothetical protein